MADFEPNAYRDYKWIVADPRLLGGALAVRTTRLSVALILECLSNGMTLEDIDESFDHSFPHEALPEVLKVASELAGSVLAKYLVRRRSDPQMVPGTSSGGCASKTRRAKRT